MFYLIRKHSCLKFTLWPCKRNHLSYDEYCCYYTHKHLCSHTTSLLSVYLCVCCTTVNVYKNASIESLVSLIYIWVGVQWTLAVCNYINSLVEKTLQILTSLSPWLLRNYISTLMYRLFWLAVEVHKTSFIWRVNL